MDNEFQSLLSNGTWTLVDLPPQRKPVSYKWILRKKLNQDGSVARFKARLVARGFSQLPGVDFSETFSPVLSMTSFRIIVSIAAQNDFLLHQMDVTTAFLNGDLTEEIYMMQPPLYQSTTAPQQVCRLHKAIYGLKQSPRQWYFKFDTFMLEHGFKRLQSDSTIYTRHNASVFLVIGIYVDDLLLLCNSFSVLNRAKHELQDAFTMTDGGELTYCLGIQVQRDCNSGHILLSQTKFIDEILRRFNMQDCNGVPVPLAVNTKLSLSMSPSPSSAVLQMKQVPYSSIMGGSRYLVTCTRSDIYFATGYLSRFMHNPGPPHWHAAKRLLRYLQFTRDRALQFNRSSLSQPILHGWSDVDWGGDIDTRKSTTRYVYLFAGGAISWQSKNQVSVALSSTEAKYVAAATAAKEALWLKRLLHEIGAARDIPITLHCDNQSCISLAQNPRHHEKTKHVDFKFHFLRDLIEDGRIKLVFTTSALMWADFLTKAVPRVKHEDC